MRHGSLFSGIGGFDLAAEWMGWENVFHCEWMEFPRKVLDYYWPNADSHTDICKTDFTKYEGTVDIISGGFPCQPFSLAGKRKGTSDERYLWGEMLRAIREIKPKWVIAENVFGITNIDGGLVFEQVCIDLENEGYEVQPFIIPAAAKNAPHRRDRCWFVAYSNGRGRCGEKGLGEHDLRRSQRKEQDNNFEPTNKGLEQRNENGNVTNPDLSGNTTQRSGINTDGQTESSQRQQPFNEFSRPRNQGNFTDTEQQRLEGQHRKWERCSKHWCNKGLFSGSKSEFFTTDTMCKRQSGKEYRNTQSGQHCQNSQRNDWNNFPTQSPICSGDDGLPTQLDGITFPKWRNESIKGYGNAIVPQIAYQLFQIIEHESKNKTTQDKQPHHIPHERGSTAKRNNQASTNPHSRTGKDATDGNCLRTRSN